MSDHPKITSGELNAYNFVVKVTVPEQRIVTIASKTEQEAKEILEKLFADAKCLEIVQSYNVKDVPDLFTLMFGPSDEDSDVVNKKDMN